ncbi:MAG TPA: segregation/condensation protein A [archaeon]|nr:segregation/condensation protein A [archaeon]
MLDENEVIKTIILGSDWQDVLSSLVVEEGMDPVSVDLIKLTEAFMSYLHKLKDFDFRVPARFILIAAILLRMKCELLLEEEEKKLQKEAQQIIPIDISNIPSLSPPMERKTVRKVTLDELISALSKAIDFKDRKESKRIRLKGAVEALIEPEEDIELKIKSTLDSIMKNNIIKFSQLVPSWHRKEIVESFLPLLYLMQRNNIACEQEGFFSEIYIKIRDSEQKPLTE